MYIAVIYGKGTEPVEGSREASIGNCGTLVGHRVGLAFPLGAGRCKQLQPENSANILPHHLINTGF